MIAGGCLCGAFRFTLRSPVGPVKACHCQQCRKLSGHYSACVDVDETALVWQAKREISEYRTSGGGVRTFCPTCGSKLWSQAPGDSLISVEAGLLETSTGTHLADHIFTADKGDYYDIADGLPQYENWRET